MKLRKAASILICSLVTLTSCLELSAPSDEAQQKVSDESNSQTSPTPTEQAPPESERILSPSPNEEEPVAADEPPTHIEEIPERELDPITPDEPAFEEPSPDQLPAPVIEDLINPTPDPIIEPNPTEPEPEAEAPATPEESQNASGPSLDGFGRCENTYDGFSQILVRLKSQERLVSEGLNPAAADERRMNSIARFATLPMIQKSLIQSMDLYVFKIPASENQLDIATALVQTNDYEYVRRDCPIRPTLTPNDTLFANQTYHTTIDSEAAWDSTTGSSSVTIAILDTGVESTHPDLSARLVAGYNAATCASTANPGCGVTEPIAAVCGSHGTQVAGVAGATGNNAAGVAGMGWNFDLMPIRISNNAVDCTASSSDMAEAIVWASEHGADIINLSYGGSFLPTIQDAGEQARRNGALLVMSAGNDTEDLYDQCLAVYAASICDFVRQNDVLIVGSVSAADTISAFSNFGDLVDMVAPGETIRTTTIGAAYADATGTSFSSPMVAGAAGLLLSANPNLSPQELTQILLSTSLDLGAAGEDSTYGRGRLDLDDAVLEALNDESIFDLADDRKLDFTIPKGPFRFLKTDLPQQTDPNPKLFMFSSLNQGLLSIDLNGPSYRDIGMAELPADAIVGPGSLFYMKDDGSSEFVFTDTGRRYVFYGTTDITGSASGDQPVIRSLRCGPFSDISAIHLTETSGVLNRLIVADRGASTVYSYVLDTDGPSLCTSGASASIQAPVFVKSLSAATPTLYIGSSDTSGLRIRRYNSTTMVALAASETITTNSRARFGNVLVDNADALVLVPIQFADDEDYGSDYIRVYNTSLALQTTFETCRAPADIVEDYEGVNRYRYVFCPNSRLVNVYDLSHDLVDSLAAPAGFKRMLVNSDGTDRYVSMLGSAASVTIYEQSIGSTADFSATTVSLPSVMDDMGGMASYLGAFFLNRDNNTISIVDIVGETLDDTWHLPTSISSIVAQSRFVSHFSSAAADTAYTLEELFNGAWKMRLYDVGDYPHQLLYRTGRLYSLNRNADTLSVVNLASRAVSSVATQDQPASMALDTTLNRLWSANYGSDSYTTVDITPGAEALVGHTALPFSPQKVLYQSSDDTIYFAGETGLRTVDGSAGTTVATQTLPGTFHDMTAISTGVWVTSLSDVSVSSASRSALTTTDLSSSPHLLTSDGSTGVVGMMNSSQLYTSDPYTQSLSQFTKLFSSASNLFVINSFSTQMRIYPYSNLGSSIFSGLSQRLLLTPEKFASDTLGNVWLADSTRLRVQRIDASFQMEAMSDVTTNRVSDLVSWTAVDRQYFILRNLNAVMVWDTSNDRRKFYSVCQTPRKLLLDTTNSILFVMCSELNSVSALYLDQNGDISSQSILSTDSRPSDMALDLTASQLFVTNRGSDSALVFDTTDLSAAPTRVTTSDEPTAVVVATATGDAHVFHAGPDQMRVIDGPTLVGTTTEISMNDFSKAVYNSTTGEIYALNRSTGAVYYNSASVTFPSATLNFTGPSIASDIAVSTGQAKTYVVFPNEDTLRIYTEDVSTVDVSVGDNPSHVYVLDAANRAYISNFNDDSVTIVNLATNAVITTISLTSGCGPRKLGSVNISGVNYISVLCDLNDTVERFHSTNYALSSALSVRISD